MSKQWALLKHKNGTYSIAADYGDYVWNSPILELIEYFPTFKEARIAKKELEGL